MRELIYALASFIAYENKKKLNQLRQLRTSQNNLPIAAHREHIIDVLSKVFLDFIVEFKEILLLSVCKHRILTSLLQV
uniref:Uncharacterized protein n=1 Tax=Parascaris equorum TaxID=6256 RepID=A0A914S0G9_PAREQ